jgi:thiol-disulfide isomerase/thioredoxin
VKPAPAPASRRTLLRAGAGLGLSSLAPLAALASGNDSQVWPSGQPAPALRTTDVAGRPVQLADHRGKLLLVNFWASWCGPCRVEMPGLARLPELFGEDRLVVVGLNVKEGARAVSLFLQRTGVQMPVWMDPQGEITRAWGVSVYPTTFILDRQGQMCQRIRGEVDWSASEPLAWLDRWIAA